MKTLVVYGIYSLDIYCTVKAENSYSFFFFKSGVPTMVQLVKNLTATVPVTVEARV